MSFRWQVATCVAVLIIAGVLLAPTEWFHSNDDLVFVEASLDTTKCPDRERPLSLSVRNGSSKTVKRVRYDLTIYEPGDSRNYADFTQPEWTLVVRPGETLRGCGPVETIAVVPRAPVVTAKKRYVEFFRDDETVP